MPIKLQLSTNSLVKSFLFLLLNKYDELKHKKKLKDLFVELVLLLVLLDVVLVALLEVLGQHDVAILSDRVHARLLANGVDVSAGDLIGSGDVILQVDVFRQIHSRSDGGEHESLLPAVGERELDLTIQTAGTEQSWIQRVGTIRCHDDLHVGGLVESVHLVQQLEKDSLDLAIRASLKRETFNN